MQNISFRFQQWNPYHSRYTIWKKNDFHKYTLVIEDGEYTSAITVDTSFGDIEIDGKTLQVSFDRNMN